MWRSTSSLHRVVRRANGAAGTPVSTVPAPLAWIRASVMATALLSVSPPLHSQTDLDMQSAQDGSPFKVVATCSAIEPGTWTARFFWPGRFLQETGSLELTAFFNGFDDGRYETIARLSPDKNNFEWRGGNPGAQYLWRVRSGQQGKSTVSATSRYQVPVCPVDYVDPKIDEPGTTPPRDPVKPVD